MALSVSRRQMVGLNNYEFTDIFWLETTLYLSFLNNEGSKCDEFQYYLVTGKFIGNKKSGHLFANMDSIEENTRYYFYLINRPILVLKCDQGFVGYKGAGSVKLECNKATYETIQVERVENGLVHFKGEQDTKK